MTHRDFARLDCEEAEMYGSECREAFDTAPVYAGFPRNIPVADVEKFFLPPESESMTQFAQPLDPKRAAWRRGWQREAEK